MINGTQSDTPRSSADGCPARDLLEAAMLRGDRDGAARILKGVDAHLAAQWRDALLRRLTAGCLEGRLPFSQLTAAAQAACLLCDDQAPPVACCGAIAGNTSATGRDFMLMLLHAWGVPALDLGVDVPESAFLGAVAEHGVRFVVCVAFSRADLERVRRLDRQAAALGIRDRFDLLVTGAQMEHGDGSGVPWDCPDHRAAAVAEWVVRRWRA